MSAEERRAAVLAAAAPAFAAGGLVGTSTETIAAQAGISQPYLFRLFPTKVDLFLAAVEQCFDRVEATFRERAEGVQGEAALGAIGNAYGELIDDRNVLRLQLQAYAAAAAEGGTIRELVRRRYLGLVDLVGEATGADPETIQGFFAMGMLCNLVAALGPGEGSPFKKVEEKDLSGGLLGLLRRDSP
jgi:AcrR family transcriptional regulator